MVLIHGGRSSLVSKITLYSVLKLLLATLLIYEGWYIEKYGAIPYFLQLLALLIIVTTAFLPGKKSLKIGPRHFTAIMWLIFWAVMMVAALFCSNTSHAVSELVTFLSFYSVFFCAGVVSRLTDDYSWIRQTIILVAVLCAFCSIVLGYPYVNGNYVVTTMGEGNNPNTLGVTMVFGLYYLLIGGKIRISSAVWAIRIALSLVFVYVIINTGSRSSLICGLCVIFFSIYHILKKLPGAKAAKLAKRVFAILIVSISLISIALYLLIIGRNNGSIIRFIERLNFASFYGREHLYQAAWQLFKSKPIFGIGYKCFEIVSGHGYYSHSTYGELLSCCGIIGALLFGLPFLRALSRSLKIRYKDGGASLALMMYFAILGFFGIWFYNLVHFLILYITIINVDDVFMLTKEEIISE